MALTMVDVAAPASLLLCPVVVMMCPVDVPNQFVIAFCGLIDIVLAQVLHVAHARMELATGFMHIDFLNILLQADPVGPESTCWAGIR